MIYVYVVDVGTWSEAQVSALLEHLPPFMPVPRTEDKMLLRHRVAVRAMLHRLLGEVSLTYDDRGAPRLTGTAYRVSISHEGDLCALALSEDSAIGVDVQRIEADEERTHRLAERFLSHVPIEPAEKMTEISVHYFDVNGENANKSFQKSQILRMQDASIQQDEEFFVRWTRLEAVLKACGCGFEAFARIGQLWPLMRLGTTVLTDGRGRRYALSLAAQTAQGTRSV